MKRRAFLFIAALTAAAACAQDGPSSYALNKLFKAYSSDTAPYFPFTASDNGAHRYDSVFANDLSDRYRTGLKSLCTAYKADLQGIDRLQLNAQEQLSYEIFSYRLDSCIRSFEYPWYLMPVNQMGMGWPSSFPVIGSGRGSHPFRTVRNYEDFLSRIDGFVEWMDTAITRMREGVALGLTQPRDLMIKVVPQLEAQIVSDPTGSLFYEPIRNFPANFGEDDRQRLTVLYRNAIETKIVPAYRRLRDFVRNEYLPACRASAGLRELPNGAAIYRQAVGDATTTSLAPEQVFALGSAEVERIRAAMTSLRQVLAASGEPEPARYRDVDSLLAGYRDLRSAVENQLTRYFGRLPKTDFEIRAIESYREKSMPSSYIFPAPDGSRPGVFYLNTAYLKSAGHGSVSRSLFLHEAIPGHHLQVALQRENRQLPLFRRTLWYSAFGEGWALYAEALGQEMGMYQNHRDRLVMLKDELFRAARLVVDVGIHDKGWTRQQAIDYLVNTAEQSEENAEREVERYMAWPGQALSYKIGQLKILELRRNAERALGDKFDVRAFHDELLADGAMPLDILEAKMERWISAQSGKQAD